MKTTEKQILSSIFSKSYIPQKAYYPFGMLQPGRKYSSQSGYRYGFNGKEKVNDIKGDGNSLDFGARIYDGRLGKWFSVDPKVFKYPGFSPYNFGLNSPLINIDNGGEDIIFVNGNKASRIGFRTLLLTPSGRALIFKYNLSETDDVYIAVTSIPDEGGDAVGARTFYDILAISPTFMNKKQELEFHFNDAQINFLKVFNGVSVKRSKGKKIHLVILNEDSEFSDDLDLSTAFDDRTSENPRHGEVPYSGAESIFHEFMSHIELHQQNSKDAQTNQNLEHNLYGKANPGVFYRGNIPIYGRPAEQIKKELKVNYDQRETGNKDDADDPRKIKPKSQKTEDTTT